MRSDRTKSIRDVWLLIAAVALIVFAVAGFYLLYTSGSVESYKITYLSVGERIYYSGRGNDGKYIAYTGGPHWLLSLKERGCVNCHGENGKGGFPLMMTSTAAPDITYASLTSGEHHHDEGSESHEEAHEHEEKYTDETIKQAITQGIEPSGERLSIIMPRWKMTEEDLEEMLEYLKEV